MAAKKAKPARKMQRVEDLCRNVVSAKALKADAPLALKDKKGVEKKYGEFLAKVLGDPATGTKLCHAMLLPLPGSAKKAAEHAKTGRLEMPGAIIERRGKASVVTISNRRYLNADYHTTPEGLE